MESAMDLDVGMDQSMEEFSTSGGGEESCLEDFDSEDDEDAWKNKACLVCSDIVERPPLIGAFMGGEFCFNSHLWSVFVLRNCLRINKEECEDLLRKFPEKDPGEWLVLCESCAEYAQTALKIHVEVLRLEKEMEEVREQLEATMKNSLEREWGKENEEEEEKENVEPRKVIRNVLKERLFEEKEEKVKASRSSTSIPQTFFESAPQAPPQSQPVAGPAPISASELPLAPPAPPSPRKEKRKKDANRKAATRYRQRKKEETVVTAVKEDELRKIHDDLLRKRDMLVREVRTIRSLLRNMVHARRVNFMRRSPSSPAAIPHYHIPPPQVARVGVITCARGGAGGSGVGPKMITPRGRFLHFDNYTGDGRLRLH